MLIVQFSHMLPQPPFIDRSDLLQQDHRILTKSNTTTGNVDMGWKSCFSCLACNRRCNYSWGILVACIVLHNKNGPCSALLTAYNRRKICIEYIAASDRTFHYFHTPEKSLPTLPDMSICNAADDILPRTKEKYTVASVIYPMQKMTVLFIKGLYFTKNDTTKQKAKEQHAAILSPLCIWG